jgi:hypothetical protein
MFINSPVQVAMLEFLERVGPSPCPALEVKFGKKTQKHLYKLRNQGYIYNLILNKVEFWIPQGYGKFNPRQQELLAWLVARWEQGGGEFENNMATSPNGMEFVVRLEGDKVILSNEKATLYVLLEDLRQKNIKDCLHSHSRTDKPKLT